MQQRKRQNIGFSSCVQIANIHWYILPTWKRICFRGMKFRQKNSLLGNICIWLKCLWDWSVDVASQGNISTFCRVNWVNVVIFGWALSCWKIPCLNTVHKWQHNLFNHQSNVQIWCYGACDKDECAFVVIQNHLPDHNPWCVWSVDSPIVFSDEIHFCHGVSHVDKEARWLQALTWPPYQRMTIRSQLHPPMGSSWRPLTLQIPMMLQMLCNVSTA